MGYHGICYWVNSITTEACSPLPREWWFLEGKSFPYHALMVQQCKLVNCYDLPSTMITAVTWVNQCPSHHPPRSRHNVFLGAMIGIPLNGLMMIVLPCFIHIKPIGCSIATCHSLTSTRPVQFLNMDICW